MKKIIGFDFDGTILHTGESGNAHQDWFNVMGYLLKSPKVKKLGNKKDYFDDVFTVMERYTGLDQKNNSDRKVMTRFARNLFQMVYLARIKKQGKDAFFDEVIEVIIDHKQKYEIALITTAPEDSVVPALKIGKIDALFDYILKSPIEEQPSKVDLLRLFMKKRGKLLIYVGNSREDAEACKELGIKFVLAKWGKFDKDAESLADYKVSKPVELNSIINIES